MTTREQWRLRIAGGRSRQALGDHGCSIVLAVTNIHGLRQPQCRGRITCASEHRVSTLQHLRLSSPPSSGRCCVACSDERTNGYGVATLGGHRCNYMAVTFTSTGGLCSVLAMLLSPAPAVATPNTDGRRHSAMVHNTSTVATDNISNRYQSLQHQVAPLSPARRTASPALAPVHACNIEC